MASYKNQHYVPRCLFKPFTLDAKGKAINLYNIRSSKFIENAPVKNQCSRNFFYGADLAQEQSLAELEGHFSRVADLIKSTKQPSPAELDWLRVFAIVQTRRTAQAISRLEQFMRQMADEVFGEDSEQRPPDPTHEELVVQSMKFGLKMAGRIDDLKMIFLENHTGLEFSISDHPAVISNRYNFEQSTVEGFGLASSGLFIVLPIAPRLALFFFDIGVYSVSIPRGTRFVSLTNVADIRMLNELQELNAEENIYFSTWPERAAFVIGDERLKQQRELRPHVERFINDPTLPVAAFRRGTAEERAHSGRHLLQIGSRHPRPRSWPAFLKVRKKPITFSNGSLAGDLRKADWLVPGALDDPS
jgi:Protein of unknown function (DUF4238)